MRKRIADDDDDDDAGNDSLLKLLQGRNFKNVLHIILMSANQLITTKK